MIGKKKKKCLCIKCQFHDKETDKCQIRNVKECSKQDIDNCIDFLVKHKLIMF